MLIMTPSGILADIHPWHTRLLAQLARRARAIRLLAIALVAFGAFIAPDQAARASVQNPVRSIAETSHNLTGRAKAFYERNGGEAIFGLPLTELIADGDLQVQYFELHAEGITLSLIGRTLTEGRADAAFQWQAAAPSAERTFYAQSGHTLGGAFGWFWQTHGGMPIFGYPISEELTERDVWVQYFERVRLEYHPDRPGAEVQISALGRDYAQLRGISSTLLAPAPPITPLGAATIAIPMGAARNVGLAARRLDGLEVAPGAEVSFLSLVGEVSPKTGYESGQVIVNGAIGSRIGGGICYVSTALYCAVFTAGLDVVERHPHSLALASLSDSPASTPRSTPAARICAGATVRPPRW
jgi:hypothetical protein